MFLIIECLSYFICVIYGVYYSLLFLDKYFNGREYKDD